MNENCELIGYVLPNKAYVGLVGPYDPILGYVDQDPATLIVGFTDC